VNPSHKKRGKGSPVREGEKKKRGSVHLKKVKGAGHRWEKGKSFYAEEKRVKKGEVILNHLERERPMCILLPG